MAAATDTALSSRRTSPTALALLVTAGAVAAAAIARQATARRVRDPFALYLRDHLSGSDVAYRVVERLARTRESADARLFADLRREFAEERDVVRALLVRRGASIRSVKRLVGAAGGAAASMAAGDDDGELAFFRTLESLAIGVQGKRLLWRVLRTMTSAHDLPGLRDVDGLEALALSQWERIEARRLAQASIIFGRGATPPV